MSRLSGLCFLVGTALLFCRPATCQDHCDPLQGPAGQTLCVYDDSTAGELGWSSCVSNSYIMAASKDGGQCDNGTPYCLYGCWDEGVLTDDCACRDTDYMPPDPTVPAWCYNPPGTGDQQCLWYRECLDRKRPCDDSDNGYALAYGERFCNLYTDNIEDSLFSQRAVDWIDAVRKCLQVALVPLLRPWHSPTCEQIRDIAFASHADCYLSPAPGAPEFCSLSYSDWLAVFWTIKGSLVSAPTAALKGIVETARGCLWQQDSNKLHPSRWLRLRLRFLMLHGERSTTGVDADADAVSGEIVDEIARVLQWDSRTLDWFGYAPGSGAAPDPEDPDSLGIDILIGDKIALGLTQAPDAPLVNLTDTVSGLVEAVRDGTLRELRLTRGNATILSIMECDNLSCPIPKPLGNEEGTEPPDNSARRWAMHPLHFLFSTVLFLIAYGVA